MIYQRMEQATTLLFQLSVQGDYEFTPQPITIGGINYNSFSPAQVKFFSSLTCNPALLPPIRTVPVTTF